MLWKSERSVYSPPLHLPSLQFCPGAQKALHKRPCPIPASPIAPDQLSGLRVITLASPLEGGPRQEDCMGPGSRLEPIWAEKAWGLGTQQVIPRSHVGSRWACPVSSVGRAWPEGSQDRHLGNAIWVPASVRDNLLETEKIVLSVLSLTFSILIHFIVYVMY